MLFHLHFNCAACCAGNRGIIEPYELGTYDGLDVKVWDWGPDVTRCAPALMLVDGQCTALDAANGDPLAVPARASLSIIACRHPSSSMLL